MERLDRGDVDGVGELVARRRGALRHVYGHLWSPRPTRRETAAAALGVAAALRPDLGREILRRVVWGLQDEAATNGGPAIPVVAEVATRSPELARDFVGPVASLVWDDGLRPEIRSMLERVAAVDPEIISALADHLRRLIRRHVPEELGWWEQLVANAGGGHDGA